MKWIQAKSGNECVSVSTDGQILWWENKISNKKSEFILSGSQIYGGKGMEVSEEKAKKVFGGSCLEFHHEMPTK